MHAAMNSTTLRNITDSATEGQSLQVHTDRNSVNAGKGESHVPITCALTAEPKHLL